MTIAGERRPLGRDGLPVSRLGLGTWTWGSTTPPDQARQHLTMFCEAGGNFVDTAPSYGDGAAETIIGNALMSGLQRHQVVIATKAGIPAYGAPTDVRSNVMVAELNRSLGRLGTDHVDLWQVHAWSDETPIDEPMSALEQALATGKARAVGVCNYPVTALRDAVASPGRVASIQTEYSLLNRQAEASIAQIANHHGLAFLAWAPVAGGVLTGKYLNGRRPPRTRAHDARRKASVYRYIGVCDQRVEIIIRTAVLARMTPAQLALAWVLQQPFVTTALIGARTTPQLQDALTADFTAIAPELVDILNAATDLS